MKTKAPTTIDVEIVGEDPHEHNRFLEQFPFTFEIECVKVEDLDPQIVGPL